MKSYNITYISPLNGRQVMELDVNANRLFDRDGETWFKYDDDIAWYNPETGEAEFRVCEVITATQCDTKAKESYMAQYGTASE